MEGEIGVAGYPKHSRAYVTFQMRLPPDLKRQLEEYAYRTNQSQIAVVTVALEEYLHQVQAKEPTPEPRDTGGPLPSAPSDR